MPDEVRKPDEKVSLEGVKLIFRNFSGNPTQYNAEGKREFNALLDPETAARLKSQGWNVKWLEGRVEGEEPQAFLPIAVSFKSYPPNIMLVTKAKKTRLNEDTVGILDWAEIKHADLTFRPYSWEVNGKSGLKAYLKELYVVIEEDEFSTKYQDIPTDSEPQMRAAYADMMEEGA